MTLDLAKTLEIGGSGLKRGLCRSLAEDGTMWIVEDDTRIAFFTKLLETLGFFVTAHHNGALLGEAHWATGILSMSSVW